MSLGFLSNSIPEVELVALKSEYRIEINFQPSQSIYNLSLYTSSLLSKISSVLTSGLQSVEYNTSHLNNGIYIYKISSENEDITGKLIIK